jgi:hypothetical protein
MELRKALLNEHSRRNTAKVIDYVGDNPKRFKELIELFFEQEYRISQRAAGPLSYCIEAHPNLVTPYLPKVIRMLKTPGTHDTLKRNIVRFLQFMDIPWRHQGAVADCCFTFLADPKVAIAIRVFSMTVLGNLAKEIPELRGELRIIIEDNIPYGTPAFRSRARKVLKALGHELNKSLP